VEKFLECDSLEAIKGACNFDSNAYGVRRRMLAAAYIAILEGAGIRATAEQYALAKGDAVAAAIT
jgi:hypothetical protein